MLKIKKCGLGFIFICVALAFSVVALALFLHTFNVGGYTLSRRALTCTVLSVWFLILLAVNTLFVGDKKAWTGILYALAVFLLVYGFTQFIHPCLTPIGFTLGAGDLNMGDTELNKKVTELAIVTAVFYIVAVICVVAASFFSGAQKPPKAQKESL